MTQLMSWSASPIEAKRADGSAHRLVGEDALAWCVPACARSHQKRNEVLLAGMREGGKWRIAPIREMCVALGRG